MRTARGTSDRSSSTPGFTVTSWLIPWAKTVEPESGRVIRRSWNKTLQKMAFAGLAAGGGVGVTCISLGAAANAWAKKPDYLVGILAALAALALIGLFLLALGALLIFVYVLALCHKERLVLGRRNIQSMLGTTKANLQVPFDNIRKIAWATRTEPDGADYAYIGIDLVDVSRDDTILSPGSLETNRQHYAFDVVILDDYEMPLESLFDELVARWEHDGNGKRSSPPKRRRTSRKSPRNLIGNLIVVGVLLLFLAFGAIALLFIGRDFVNRLMLR